MPTTILDGETYEQARHRRFTEEAKVIEKIQQDEIIRMALEACAPNQTFNSDEEWVKRFAALVAEPWIETSKALAKEIIELKKQAEQEPVAWDLAEKVRRDLDRKSCPDAYMRIAMESIVKHYAAPASVEAAVLAEREACAKVCDEEAKSWARLNAQDEEGFGAIQCAAAIRGLK